jgi:protein ImuB
MAMFGCIFIPQSANGVNGDALLRLAFSFSPRVELVGPGTALMDTNGLEQLFGSPEQLTRMIVKRAADCAIQVNVATSQDAETAIHASRGFVGITVIQPGEEARVLSSLPLTMLCTNLELEETWHRWGLKTFGDFAALPEAGIAERLGPEGARLHRIARGTEQRSLIPLIPALEFEASQVLEYPIELLEPLAFILASLLNQVCASLQARAKGASEIRLRLALRSPADKTPFNFERQIRLPVPMRDSIALLKLLRLDLEAHPPQAPIVAVSLRAEAAEPRVTQNNLFIPPAPEPERLELTLARIAKLVGAQNAGSPELLDTHRPDAFIIRDFQVLAQNGDRRRPNYRISAGTARDARDECSQRSCPLSLRVFRPPLWAEVECSGGKPESIRARGIQGKVTSCTGPWRMSGGWWNADSWAHDEWDIDLAPSSQSRRAGLPPKTLDFATPLHTRLFRIYHDLLTSSWYIRGSYD